MIVLYYGCACRFGDDLNVDTESGTVCRKINLMRLVKCSECNTIWADKDPTVCPCCGSKYYTILHDAYDPRSFYPRRSSGK